MELRNCHIHRYLANRIRPVLIEIVLGSHISIAHTGAYCDDFLDSSFENERHEYVDEMDLANDVGGEELVELLSEAFGILSEHGEGVIEGPFGDETSVGDQVVEASGCDGGGHFGSFLRQCLVAFAGSRWKERYFERFVAVQVTFNEVYVRCFPGRNLGLSLRDVADDPDHGVVRTAGDVLEKCVTDSTVRSCDDI